MKKRWIASRIKESVYEELKIALIKDKLSMQMLIERAVVSYLEEKKKG